MTILERLNIIKDIDPFNQQLLNDCYLAILQLQDENECLRKQLGMNNDASQDNGTENNSYEGY